MMAEPGMLHIKQEPPDMEGITDVACSNSPHPPTHPPQLISLAKYARLEVHHRSRAYDIPQNSCEVCQGEFADQSLLVQHKLLHFNTSHVCYMCDCYFMSTPTMIMHMATIHRNLNPSLLSVKGDADRAFVCSVCLQRFSSNKMLQLHQNNHQIQEDNYFGCKVCGLDFIGYRALMAHLNASRHKEMKIKIQGIFVCVDCRSIFASRDSYAMHMMLRAQNETCSIKNSTAMQRMVQSGNILAPKGDRLSSAAAAVVAAAAREPHSYEAAIDGADPRGSADHLLKNEKSPGSPLNLSVQKSLVDGVRGANGLADAAAAAGGGNLPAPQHRCTKCGLDFSNDGSFAMHIMMHVKNDVSEWHGQQSRLVARAVAPPIGGGSFSAPLPASALQSPTMGQVRPNSAPAPPPHMLMHMTSAKWTCNICSNMYDTCDALAMHVMDTHANQDATNSMESAKKSFSSFENKGEPVIRESSITDTSAVGVAGGKPDQDVESRDIPVAMTDDIPAGIKRSSSVLVTNDNGLLDDDAPEPKRCRSEGGVTTFECGLCGDTAFLSKAKLNQHVIHDHGVSLRSPACQTCNMVFLHYQALKAHLGSPRHLEAMNLGKFSCASCNFATDSEELYEEHKTMHTSDKDPSTKVTTNCRDTEEGSNINDRFVMNGVTATTGTSLVNGDSGRGPVSARSAEPQLLTPPSNQNGVVVAVAPSPQSSDALSPIANPDPASVTTGSTSSRKSKRKSGATARVIQACSPSLSDGGVWYEQMPVRGDTVSPCSSSTASHLTPIMSPPGGAHAGIQISGATPAKMWHHHQVAVPSPAAHQHQHQHPTILVEGPQRRASGSTPTPTTPALSTVGGLQAVPVAPDFESDVEVVDYVLSNANKLSMCKYCKIIYVDQTMYYLHMGLHNLNNPWQCNLCGKACRDVHEFSSHVIHY